MAISKTTIFNRALGFLGQQAILDADGNTPTALKLRSAYDFIVDSAFETNSWNFAMSRVQLALLSEESDLLYSYVYKLPGDFAKLIHTSSQYKHEIKGDKLYIDDSSINITYVRKLTDESEFTASFANYIAATLARDTANDITSEAGVFDRMSQLAKEAYRAAKKNDGQQSNISIYLNKQYSNRINTGQGSTQVNVPTSIQTPL